MKKFILYITLLMMPVLCSAKKAFVIEKDRTIIVTGEQPSPSVILAAHELQHFIKQSLDIHLPIVSEVPQQPSKIIFVGGSKYTEKVQFQRARISYRDHSRDNYAHGTGRKLRHRRRT